MSTFLLTETKAADIRLLDPSVSISGERLRALVRAYTDEDTAAAVASLFADPERIGSGDRTDWYTDLDGTAVPLKDLPEADQTALLETIGRIRAKLEDAAAGLEATPGGEGDARFLRAAVQLPSDRDHIYSVGGAPVLVGWGHRPAAAGRAAVPAGQWVPKEVATPPPQPAPKQTVPPVVQPGPATPPPLYTAPVAPVGYASGPAWLAWLLWLVFLLLLLLILALVLSACSAGHPRTSLAERLGLFMLCPVEPAMAATSLNLEESRRDVLRNQIRDAELALARDAQTCRGTRRDEARLRELTQPPPPPPPEPEPQPEPQPDPTPEDPDQAALDQRVEQAGGQRGAFQVILQWEGPADLDLSVQCADGEISYRRRQGCTGGELDVDANVRTPMQSPVENIRWERMPPPGGYTVKVRNHSNKSDQRPSIPFTVTVRKGDEISRHPGSVATRQGVDVTEVTLP